MTETPNAIDIFKVVRLTIISIDDIKKALPGYTPERADEFHEESAKLANKLFDEEIRKFSNQNVILMCGGSASGKTEFLEKFFPADFEGLVFDSTLSTLEGAKVKIRNTLGSHNKPMICFVFPDDLRRAFAAFNNRERIIPECRFYETHAGARAVVLWIAQNHLEVEIMIYENTYTPELPGEDHLRYSHLEFSDRTAMISFLTEIQYNEDAIKQIIRGQ